MPRITAGGATPPDDTVITRVDITPEDIRTMSDEQINELLARIRNQREAAAPRKGKASVAKQPKQLTEPDMVDELE